MNKLVVYIFAASLLFAGAVTAQEQKESPKNESKKPTAVEQNKDTELAEDGDAKPASPQKNKSAKKNTKTPEEIAARNKVLYQFVDEQHPKLRQLLKLLEKKRPEEFQKAMRTLSGQYDRLARIEARDPERYEIAIEQWKVRSRIKYVSAQLTVENTEEIEQSLRKLLKQDWDLVIRMRKLEIRRQEAKLAEMRENLAEQRQAKKERLDTQFEQAIVKAKKRSSVLAGKKRRKVQVKPKKEKEIPNDADMP